jgi:hypothetical protein
MGFIIKRIITNSFFIVLIYFTQSIGQVNARTIESSNIQKVKQVISALKDQGVKFKLRKRRKSMKVYSLVLKDAKSYRSLRLRRSKKVQFKGALHFEQYQTTNLGNIKKALKIYLNKGFLRKHLHVLKENRKITIYKITTSGKGPINIEDAQSISTEYSLAQSQIIFEGQSGNSEEYQGRYISGLTGVDFETTKYSGKAMIRVESFSEETSRGDTKDNFIEVDEFYMKREFGNGQLTLGRQLFSWGVFDELSNLDRVNIKNLPRFVFDYGESYRRPVSALRFEYYLGNVKVDTYLDFGLEPGKEVNEDSLWSGYDRSNGVIRGTDPNLMTATLVKNMSTSFKKRDEIGYGVRVTHSDDGDISLTYLSAYSDMPILKVSDELRSQVLSNSVDFYGLGQGVELAFVKENVFGIDYAKTLGGQLFKIEFSYIPKSLVLNDLLALEEVPKARYAIGGDIEIDLFSTTIVWQAISETLLTDKVTLVDKQLTQYILQSSSRFIEDKLELGMRIVYNGNDNSYYSSPFMNYEYSDLDIFGIATHLFSGDDNTFFGHHKDDNFTSLSYRRLF